GEGKQRLLVGDHRAGGCGGAVCRELHRQYVRLSPPASAQAVGVRLGPAPHRGGANVSVTAVETHPDVYGLTRRRAATKPRGRRGEPPLDVWARLSMLVDPAEFRPKLADDIEIKEFKLRWGRDYAMIANPRDLLHYRLDLEEADLLKLMDGTRTVKEIV